MRPVGAVVGVVGAEGYRHCRYILVRRHRKFVRRKLLATLPMRGLPSLLRGTFQLLVCPFPIHNALQKLLVFIVARRSTQKGDRLHSLACSKKATKDCYMAARTYRRPQCGHFQGRD